MGNLEITPTIIRTDNLVAYDSLDVLAHINPEIASLAYANKSGILTPEILPYIARFRELQTVDKLGLLNHIAECSRIDADERKNQVICDTQLGITKLREKGSTTRTFMHEQGETERMDLMCGAAVDINKLKYEANVRIIQEQMNGARYISDNQLRATHIQAEALRDSIIRGEEIRAMAKVRESQNTLIAVVKKAEFEYLARLGEAEALRAMGDQRMTAQIVARYLSVQASMYQQYLAHQLKKVEFVQSSQTASKLKILSHPIEEIVVRCESPRSLRDN
jgi:hypothetical protein